MPSPELTPGRSLPVQIADALRSAILAGEVMVNDRLPSEAELAARFGVSRPTVREALKRLAARNLIRTERGAAGGAFVRRLSYAEAQADMITTATLLASMNDLDFAAVAEARFALERACLPLAVARVGAETLTRLRTEIARQTDPELSDAAFCASDVAFHRALVDAAGNPVLSYHLAGAVEAMAPLMNMITFDRRSRARIAALHRRLSRALAQRDLPAAESALDALEAYTRALGSAAVAARARRTP